MNQQKKNGNLVAIITMCFIFAMISFVTNMAAPFGTIWGYTYPWAGMMGNMMNFAAYLFMGIPAGKMLVKYGYKKTALIALGVGVVGLLVQYFSSIFGADIHAFDYNGQAVALNLVIYLLGAFICGFCVCMLNTVVNPMLNILGGGGNRGNQFIQIGGTLNSLTGTLTPFLVGVLVGQLSETTSMSNVAPLLFIGIGVFAISFFIISGVAP
jgi:FHS family L-fucose permease-like MFS transporter